MTFINYLTEELGRKYTSPELVANMMKTKKSKMLNPAYNDDFRDWTNKKILPKKYYDISSYYLDLEGKKVRTIRMNYILAGMGGVGSNIAYNSQNIRFKNDRITFKLPGMDNDKWELSNLPRIPFVPNKLDKRVSDYISNHNNEINIVEPVFIELYNSRLSCTLPVGAPDLQSRKILWDTKVPWISVTHRNNQIIVELTPEPMNEIEIARETYGMVDINFFIPAMQIVTKKLFRFLDNFYGKENEFHDIAEKIKLYKYRWAVIQNILFYKKYSLGNLYYNYKINYPQEKREKSMKVKDIHRWTFYAVQKLYTSEEGIDEMIKYAHIEPKKNDIEHIKSHLPDFESVSNIELFRIGEKEVEDYLKDYKGQ